MNVSVVTTMVEMWLFRRLQTPVPESQVSSGHRMTTMYIWHIQSHLQGPSECVSIWVVTDPICSTVALMLRVCVLGPWIYALVDLLPWLFTSSLYSDQSGAYHPPPSSLLFLLRISPKMCYLIFTPSFLKIYPRGIHRPPLSYNERKGGLVGDVSAGSLDGKVGCVMQLSPGGLDGLPPRSFR